jgi:hypothetical protein
MLSASELTMTVLKEFHLRELPYLYLRNYENLPSGIGNDVDLLVAPGLRNKALSILESIVSDTGWSLYRIIEFGPLSLYLCDPAHADFLHIDLFDRLEWHWVPFADSSTILDRRIWNGLVFQPDPRDEVFLNVMTRLGYAGIVREKHRSQSKTLGAKLGGPAFVETWVQHLGHAIGSRCGSMAARGDWDGLMAYARSHRPQWFFTLVLKRPFSAACGLFRYGRRSMKRILHPPGPVIAWMGKKPDRREAEHSALARLLMKMTGREDVRILRLQAVSSVSSWLGYWKLWITQVVPSTIKNRAVILVYDPAEGSCTNGVPHGESSPRWIVSLLKLAMPAADVTIGPDLDVADVVCDRAMDPGGESAQPLARGTAAVDKNPIEDAENRVISILCARRY